MIVCVYNLPQLLSGSVQFDGVDVHYSAQRYLSDELHAGRLPFWTPYVFSGFPFLADVQVGAWYPLNWPFFLAGITPRSLGAELLLHDLIACLGAYALARRLIGGTTPAVMAGMFYGLSGWFAAHSQHVGMFDTAAWLPWLLLLLVDLGRGLSRRRLALAGALGAAIMLPGHFQLALYTFSFVGVWAVLEAVFQRSWLLARRLLAGLAVAAAWGTTLAAVMLLPAFELLSQSVRTRLNALALPEGLGYFHPASLLTLVDPDFYGLLSGHYTGPGDRTQHEFYAGVLLVPLALLGASNLRIVRTAAALGLPFVWYALGPPGGVFRLVARLPGFSSVELPMHGWFLPALGLALVAAAGVARVHHRVGPTFTALLVPLVLVDVLTVNQLLNPLAYARASFQDLYGRALDEFAVQVAQARPAVSRVYGPPLASVGYRNHALQSRVETTYGYNPLELAAYADYIDAAESNPRLIAGLAPSHALADGSLERVADALPLASFAQRVIAAPDQPSAQQRLRDLDPAAATLVVGASPAVAPDASATVAVLGRGPDWLKLRYAARTPNLLRVTIPSYPGWHATLNDQALPMVPVDVAFLGVVVPPGEGTVELAYAPRWFWPGAAISCLALLGLLLALWLDRGRAR